jgi:hypothetical protein
MISLFSRAQVGALVVMLAGAAMTVGLGRMVVPSAMWLSTYLAFLGVAAALGAVTLTAASNARPTGSLGQLLYQTELADADSTRRLRARWN